MRPISMSVQVVMDEHKRLSIEIEVVTASGDIVSRRVDANTRHTIFFDETEDPAFRPSTPPAPA
jgi:hypothetical protein